MAARLATNLFLHQARRSKADEFYTQMCDIESELKHYKHHFKDKVVYCNCDDPRVSNFYKYFVANFHELGLKKVIASRYVGDGALDFAGLFSYLDTDNSNSDQAGLLNSAPFGHDSHKSVDFAVSMQTSDLSSIALNSSIHSKDGSHQASSVAHVGIAANGAAAGANDVSTANTDGSCETGQVSDLAAVADTVAMDDAAAIADEEAVTVAAEIVRSWATCSYVAAQGNSCASDGLFSAEIALRNECARILCQRGYDESDHEHAQLKHLLHGQVTEFDGNDIRTTNLEGNGDFRSEECIELLKTCDIVVTNPPFSLFREFISTLVAHDKDFLVIANVNAITYKEIFGLIQKGKAWLGVGLGRDISGFIVPPHYILYGSEVYIDNKGNRIVSPNNCLWLTTLDIAKRHVDIPLTKTYVGNEDFYKRYDNLDGINVNKTKDIPKDYAGLMGVPITFLHKYNPDQFELVRFRKGDDNKDLSINGKCPYFRIVVRNRRPQIG